jgi:hypothetical protein
VIIYFWILVNQFFLVFGKNTLFDFWNEQSISSYLAFWVKAWFLPDVLFGNDSGSDFYVAKGIGHSWPGLPFLVPKVAAPARAEKRGAAADVTVLPCLAEGGGIFLAQNNKGFLVARAPFPDGFPGVLTLGILYIL